VKLSGRQYYRENTWNQDHMQEYRTEITAMDMIDNERAEIRWTFSGKLGPIPVSGKVTSSLKLNVLTGRIEEQTDEVELTGNPLGQLQYRLMKWTWAQKLHARQVGEKVRRYFSHRFDRFSDFLVSCIDS
jgi:hypothetical protein